MAGAGVLRLAAKMLAKKLARKKKNIVQGNYWESSIGDQSRLPEGIEFLRGYARRQPMESYMAKGNLTPEDLAALPTHVDTIPLRNTIKTRKG